jgi:hypothetical protein
MQAEQALSHASQVLVLVLGNVPVEHKPTQLTPLKYPMLQLKQLDELRQVLHGALQGTH